MPPHEPIAAELLHAVGRVVHTELAASPDGFQQSRVPEGWRGYVYGIPIGVRDHVQHDLHAMGGLSRPLVGPLRLPYLHPGFAAGAALTFGGATAMAATGWPASQGVSPMTALFWTSIGVWAANVGFNLGTQLPKVRNGAELMRVAGQGFFGPTIVCLTGFGLGHLLTPESMKLDSPVPQSIPASLVFGLAMLAYASDVPFLSGGLAGEVQATYHAHKQRQSAVAPTQPADVRNSAVRTHAQGRSGRPIRAHHQGRHRARR